MTNVNDLYQQAYTAVTQKVVDKTKYFKTY